MSVSATELSPYKARPHILKDIQKGLVPFLKSSPGIGKSALVKSIAEEEKLFLIDHRISTSAPTDLSGLPDVQDGRAAFNPFDVFPIEGLDKVPPGYKGFLLFLDEFNSGQKSTLAAAYKLVLDKMVGRHHLHKETRIICAGNQETDRAITTNIGTALQSRLSTYNIILDPEEFILHVMVKQQWDDRLVAFLSANHGAINDFKPDHQGDNFCCPRTWDFVNIRIKGEDLDMSHLPAIASKVTAGEASNFLNFLEVYQHLPNFEQVIQNPTGYPVPGMPNLKWATVSSFAKKTKKENFERVMQFISRFDMTFQVLFFRMTVPFKPELRELPSFPQVAVKFAKYMFDDIK